jgi:GNAT superfamily N-acetyltransferase
MKTKDLIIKFAKIRKKIYQIKAIYHREGFREFITKVIYQQLPDLIILKRDLNDKINLVSDRMTIQCIEAHHFEDLAKLHSDIHSKSFMIEFEEYQKNNCFGYMARIQGSIIGHIWWADHRMGYEFKDPDTMFMRRKLKLNRKDAYLFDYFIAPKSRGGGNSIEFLNKVLLSLRESGYTTIIGCVKEHNFPAKWTYSILGFKNIQKVHIYRLFLFFVIRGDKLFFDFEGYDWLLKDENLTINSSPRLASA